MKVIQRFGYYIGGFSVGLVLLAFFLKGAGTEIPSCDYLPEARVLKTVRNYGYSFSTEAEANMAGQDIDTVQLNQLFKEGSINFDKSDPRRKPCGLYQVELPDTVKKRLIVKMQICDTLVTLNAIDQR